MKNGKIVISVTVRFSFCQGRKRRAVPFPVTPVRVFPTGGGGGGRERGVNGEAGIAGDGGGRDSRHGRGRRREASKDRVRREAALGTALPLVSEARVHADEEVHASVTASHASEGLSPPKVKIAPA